MKEYVVAGVMKPYNEGDNKVDNFNIKFYSRKELEDFLFDLEDMELEDCPPADVVMKSVNKANGYRFSAGNMDFIIKFNDVKEYVVAEVLKPYNVGDNDADSFNIRLFRNGMQLENFIFDLEDMDLEGCPPADVVLQSIDKVHGYRFSAGDMDFIVKFNK